MISLLIHRMTGTFGKLDKETLELSDGLNIIQAPNETGKSTWCAFLLSMFYGINSRDRDKAGYIADKNRYNPWSGAPMSGRLDCRSGKDDLTLLRETKRQNASMGDFKALYAGTADPVPYLSGTDCGETLLGVSREVYERSAFIRQAGLPISQDAGLEKRIAALITTGEEDTSYSEAADTLKKQLNRRRHNKTGQLPALESELTETRRQLEQLSALHAQASAARSEAEAMTAREAELTAQLRLHDLWDAARQREALEEVRTQAGESRQRAETLRSRLEDERIPENEAIARLRGAIVNLETVRKSVDKAMQEKDAAMKDSLRAEAAVNEGPFMGQSVESARKEAQVLSAASSTGTAVPLSSILSGLLGAALGGFLGGAVGWLVYPSALFILLGGGALTFAAIFIAISHMRLSARNKIRRAALTKRFGTSDPAQIEALAERYAALCQKRDAAQNAVTAATAVYTGLYNSLISNEQAILLEVRRFAPAAFDVPAADAALRECAVRRKELTNAQDAAREAELRLEYQRQHIPAIEDAAPPPAAPPSQSREVLNTALSQTRDRRAAARSASDRLSGQISAIGDRAALEAREEELASETARLEEEYTAISLAMAELAEANTTLQNRFSPELGRRTAEIFSALTGGHYDGVVLDRSFRFSVEPSGDPSFRDAQLLSAGALDQLYLAARLAICELVLPSESAAPIVLDDALANFDDHRMEAALQWLKQAAQHRQILLFTCHGREAAFFREDGEVSIRELTPSPCRV